MKLGELLELIKGPERIRITDENKKVLYAGFRGTFELHEHEADAAMVVTRVGIHTEIFRKENRENVLFAVEGNVPALDMITDIPYRDLEECIYTRIETKKES